MNAAPAVISGLIAQVLDDLGEKPPFPHNPYNIKIGKHKKVAVIKRPVTGNATKNGKFIVGDHVLHKNFGVGFTVAQWGSWYCCRECNLDVTTLPVNGFCPHCHRKTGWTHISGREIYQVRFGNDRLPRSINQCWLTKAKK